MAEKKKGFFAKLAESLGKKLETRSKQKSCYCSSEESTKAKKSCCR